MLNPNYRDMLFVLQSDSKKERVITEVGASHSNTIFQKPPNSTQNPLLSKSEFFKHCKRRFRWVGNFERGFVEWLEPRLEKGLIREAYRLDDVAYFSTFQTWQVHRLGNASLESGQSATSAEFENLLRLLTRIQDFYLPEIRSNQRFGEYRDYHGKVAIGGTYFCTKTQYLLSDLREWRQRNIEGGYFDLAQALSNVDLDVPALMRWFNRLMAFAEDIDLLSKWRMLIKYFRYSKRQKLEFEALLAQDFYEIAELLGLFISDLDSGEDISNPTDWSDIAPHERSSNIPQWKIERYGESLSRPYEMLEFLSNEYDLNPKPRAIIFTEGEEWRAVEKLYAHYGYNPELLGMELRSISGEGNFSLANWQCFIEYMHEKQVLVYFLLDNEGHTVNQAKRLLNKKRTFSFPGLEKVIPSRDRIKVWSRSFEESNFTDAEIRRALARQGIRVSSRKVAAIRTRTRTKGLINTLSDELGEAIDKPRLDVDLADALISRCRKRPGVKSLRPIERFVKRSGDLIMLNHQPAGQDIQRLNIETGLLG